jgi:hypothetical protein
VQRYKIFWKTKGFLRKKIKNFLTGQVLRESWRDCRIGTQLSLQVVEIKARMFVMFVMV